MSPPQLATQPLADPALFDHFTAPNGIARLRELILQLAVQGKLGTQDPGDEPASVLLERIRKEKERLMREGQIKKDKPLEKIKVGEVSYRIPDSWILTRLGYIARYNAEIKVCAKEVSDDAWVLDLEDIEKNTSHILQKVRFKDRQSLSSKSRFNKGDILYGKLRPYLNKVVVADEGGYCTTEIVPIRPYGKIFPKFLMYALKTPDFLSYVNSKTYGIKMPRLGTTDALNTIIPLPPLAEQHRIVAKVDRLLALCDELEARQQQERAGCLKLGTASLTALQNAECPEEFERQWTQVCEAFEQIFDCPENVGMLRQTILQLAVEGRLVKQDPDDEPANNILNNQKIKPLNVNEIPFELPHGWIGVNCNSICDKNRIITYGVIKLGLDVKEGIPILRSSDVKFLYINPRKIKRIDPSIASQYQRTFLQGGDIVINVRGTLGGISVVPQEMVGYNISREVAVIPLIHQISKRYIAFTLASPFCQNWLSKNTKGIAYSGINIADLKQLPIPLPPLAEQHRIVAKVDALMALCDALEARLKERAAVQEKFAVAVVKHIAGGVQCLKIRQQGTFSRPKYWICSEDRSFLQ